MPTIDDYKALIEDRPPKFSAEEVNYRHSETLLQRCVKCIHYYERKRDSFGVCEIFRSDDTDVDGVDQDYVCDFWSVNGEQFPLLKKKAR